jgi:hypothetical protein
METRMLDDTSVRTPENEGDEQHLMRGTADWALAWEARRIARLGRFGTGEGQPIESGWARDEAE